MTWRVLKLVLRNGELVGKNTRKLARVSTRKQENFLHSGISALLDSESWRETGKAGGRERPRDMEKRARAGNKPGLLQQGLSLNTWYALY